MEKITQFALKNTRLTILFIIALVILGTVTFLNMPSSEDPKITIRSAQVQVYYPGMSISLMEDLIAKPLEKKIKEIPELDKIKTTVKNGVVLLQVNIKDRYFDMEPIWQDLRNKMNDAKTSLPSGTIGPIVNDDYGNVAAATIALYGDGFAMNEIRDLAYDLQDKIGALASVSKVELFGVQDEKIYAYFNASKMAFYGISKATIIKAIKQQNIILPGGSVVAGDKRMEIEPSGNFKSLEEIKNVQIKTSDNKKVVYLRDLLDLKREYANPPTNPVFYNNNQTVVISVSMAPKLNIDDFDKELSAKIKEIKKDLPSGMNLDLATYQPPLVKKSVSEAVDNLWQTIAVVLAVVIIFLGVRTGLIVGSIVPLTILMSLIIMQLWGVELHRMSIAAIIIALGLLVDNGIVIAEDIQGRIDSGTPKKDAALQAASSLGFPLLTSSLTTMLAFLPLMLAENVLGEFLKALSQVMIATLFASWFLALFITPVLCYWFLKENKSTAKTENLNEGKSYDFYRKFLQFILNHKAAFIILMVVLLIISMKAMSGVTKQMMPYSDRNQILVYLDLPAGSDINHTIATSQKLTSWLSDKKINPEIDSNVAYVGFGGPRFFLALSPPDPGNNVAFIVVNTKNHDAVRPTIKSINQFILDEMPEVNGRVKQMWLGSKEIGIVEYRIKGYDTKELYNQAHKLEIALKNIKGTVAVMNDWQNPISRIQVNIDQSRASRSSITNETIANELGTYYDGAKIDDYREGDKIIPIVMRGSENRDHLSDLSTISLLSDSGKQVPLMQVASFNSKVEPGRLVREDQIRTITVSAKHSWLQATDLHNKLLPTINSLNLPEGYSIEFGGEIESSGKANKALFAKMPLALFGIALLLVWQFNSIRRPAIILLTIPLVLIGAAIGLIAMNAFMSFTAMLGLFSLAGIIVNNGIVLIDRIDLERQNENDVQKAVITACLARMRPIVMTTLTTILGLIPMLLFGGDLWYPMAVVIIFGLTVGSVLTLGFVPVLYVLFFDTKLKPKLFFN